MLFTHNGMAVRFNESLVRSMGRVCHGVRGVTLKSPEDFVVACVVVNGDESILIVCEKGFGKRSLVEGFRQTNRGAVGVRSILTSDRNGLVIGAIQVSDPDSVFLMSNSGQALRIRMKDVRVMGRSTQGVRLVNLRPEDKLIGMQKVSAVVEDNE
jgi:DNA gyrase subunit A